MTESVDDLALVRAGIDEIDHVIVQQMCARERLVRRAGRLKADAREVPAPARVEQVIVRVRALAVEYGASPKVVERTYRAMIGAFIDLELDVQARSAHD